MNHVLIVEDDKEIREGVEIYLKSQGYVVFQAADGVEGLEVIEKEEIHLAIVDVMMPRMDGIQMTVKLREKYDFPVIFLSAKSEEVDKIMGLNMGADDYVTKPFNSEILLAKAKVLLSRIEAMTLNGKENIQEDILEYNGVKLDKLKMEVYIDDEQIEIEPKQFEVLEYLMENKNIVISREKLLETKWGYDYYGNTRVVDAQIKKLRKNLKHKSYCIKTIFGSGYKFDVE